jgi:hypothetical protein
MEIDVFPLLFSSKSKREFKEKRLERVGGGGGKRGEESEEERSPESSAVRGLPTRRARTESAFPQPPRARSF